MRVGFGFDSHRLVQGRRLMLGGVEIPCERGLLGHSDADVLIHAICDAILGAMAAGDIGRHFSDTDPVYRDISSLKLLEYVKILAEEKGYDIYNIDSTVILEKPKISDYIPSMLVKLSGTLNIPLENISIKAKTNEGMGMIGCQEGAAAYAVVMIIKREHQ